MSRHFLLLTVGMMSFLGCAQQNTILPSPKSFDGVLIEVQNSNTQDLKLYVVEGAMRVRIGLAPSLRTTRLRVPLVYTRSVLGLELEAQPLGGGEPVRFTPGVVSSDQRVVLLVNSALRLSTFAVYGLN